MSWVFAGILLSAIALILITAVRLRTDAPYLFRDPALRLDVFPSGIALQGSGGPDRVLAWSDIVEVRIETTDEGPLADDVVWVVGGEQALRGVERLRMGRGAARAGLLAGLALLTFTACRHRPVPAPGSMAETEVTILARNYHSDHVTFYYSRGASKRLLGSVPGGRSESFRIPWSSSQLMSFEIDMFDGKRCYTPSYTVFPGEGVFVWLRFARPPSGRQCDFRVEDEGR